MLDGSLDCISYQLWRCLVGPATSAYENESGSARDVDDLPSESPVTTVRVETCIGTLSLFRNASKTSALFQSPTRCLAVEPTPAVPAVPGSAPRRSHRRRQLATDRRSIDPAAFGRRPERIASSYLSMPEMQQIAEDVSSSSSSNARADGESATAYPIGFCAQTTSARWKI
jgi:hypothetical protein